MLGGGDLNAMLRVMVVLGFIAASQQTFFIVSGSPSNPTLGGGELNHMGAHPLEQSQLQFHTSLLRLEKIIGKNQLKTFVVDYDKINYRHLA